LYADITLARSRCIARISSSVTYHSPVSMRWRFDEVGAGVCWGCLLIAGDPRLAAGCEHSDE
jgi:hypothetical protein